MNTTYKIVTLGSIGVGKTAIINRYFYDTFKSTQSTIGASYYSKKMNIDKKEITLQFWDCCGIDGPYGMLVPHYYRGSHVALLCYDVTSYGSFNIVLKIIDDLKCKIEDISIILIGNKIDLPKIILTEDVDLLIEKYNLIFIECSAKTGENINVIFDKILDIIKLKIKPKTITLSNDKKLSHCCQ